MAPQHKPSRISLHILKSYSALRWVMFALGILLPPCLVWGGVLQFWWLDAPLPIQQSLSAYYHAGGGCMTSLGVYRNLFVGFLCVIGASLFMYSGFSKLEDILLDLAGFLLLLVALFPTDWTGSQLGGLVCEDFKPFQASLLLGLPISIHHVAAIGFFLAITLVNYKTALISVAFISDADQQKRWRQIFNVARFLMPASLLLAFLLSRALDPGRWVLWMEWAGIWAFSIYWLLKSLEILGSKVDVNLIESRMVLYKGKILPPEQIP